ncbi:hypothetical protein [Aureivirga sp. CE67]|uniref:hypothetical protein n=1 Tax=Aureivirga sp. CE67 TaxID=1788983 RepID=UPI0018CA1D1F|nr:hypothetical protein [Aureivirga sp. CE67]
MKLLRPIFLLLFIFSFTNSFSQVKSVCLETIAKSKILVIDNNSTYEISQQEFSNSNYTNINLIDSLEAKSKYGKYGNGNMIEITLNPISLNQNKELIFLKSENNLKLVTKDWIEKINSSSISTIETLKGRNAVENYGFEARFGVVIYTIKS